MDITKGASPASVNAQNLGLGDIYDSIKATSTETNPTPSYTMPLKGDAIRLDLLKKSHQLKDNCYRHILVDMYCKILPLDKEYIDGHMGQMKCDVDAMLKSKGMTPTQYITSCYESTSAPMLEFIMRSVNNIGKGFVEAAEEKIKDEQDRGIDAPMPEVPEDPTENEDVNNQLIDVQKDTEYENFIDKLKEKTIKKIVADISKIITDKKEDNDMSFNPKPVADMEEATESAASIGMRYLQMQLIKENVDTSKMTDNLLGFAIRESTLCQFDRVFNLPGCSFRETASRLRWGKGYLINESAVRTLMESGDKSADEVDDVVNKANKERDEKINSKLKASDVVNSKNDDTGKKSE